jgi:hypothetical protein
LFTKKKFVPQNAGTVQATQEKRFVPLVAIGVRKGMVRIMAEMALSAAGKSISLVTGRLENVMTAFSVVCVSGQF